MAENVNKKMRSLNIKWDNDCLHENDIKFSTNVLLISRRNQKKNSGGVVGIVYNELM